MKHTNLFPRGCLKHHLEAAKEPTLTFHDKSRMFPLLWIFLIFFVSLFWCVRTITKRQSHLDLRTWYRSFIDNHIKHLINTSWKRRRCTKFLQRAAVSSPPRWLFCVAHCICCRASFSDVATGGSPPSPLLPSKSFFFPPSSKSSGNSRFITSWT